MAQEEIIKQFEAAKIRVIWDEEQETYFFSVVDVIRVLTDSVDATSYWRKLKQRLKEEGNETVTNCHALKMTAEAATTEINEKEKPKGFAANAKTAKRGGSVAGVARKKLEKELGRSVVTKDKAIDYIRPKDELPFPKKEK